VRIAVLGPFTGASLSAQFEFPPTADGLPAGYPGAPLMTVLAKALADRGHEVAAISTDFASAVDQTAPFKLYQAPGISAYFCPQRARSFRRSGTRRGRALDFFQYERDCLLAALEDFAPAVIHAHWTYEFVWAALDSKYPTLATAHDSPAKVLRYMPNLYRAFRYLMARRVIPRCGHLTAVSPDLAADIRRYAKSSISVVPNPIATHVMAAAGCTKEAFEAKTLLMVLNGWNNLKNGALALRAFNIARRSNPGLRLICFGAAWEKDGEAHRWARRNGVDAGVEFCGSVPQRVILEQMQMSTALLHPSRWEACCMAIAEAMSLGLPVIAGRHTDGVAWQLDNGRAGILADITSVDDVARGIVAMTSDFFEWQKMSTAGRSRARQIFSVDRVVDQYVSLYSTASNGARNAAIQ